MESKSMESVENQEKNNVPKTPAARSSRRRAPAVSARGKLEAQNEEKSVQRVYSTRHSVRLLEKGMEGLGLKEKERVRPLKMDGLCWEIEDVETKDETGKYFCFTCVIALYIYIYIYKLKAVHLNLWWSGQS
jgi:hypothetical protein